MFVTHLPAGYVLTRRILALGLLASVLPDFDLLYFYLIDDRQTLHHLYWPHLPVFWLAPAALSLLICGWAVAIFARSKRKRRPAGQAAN